MKNYYHILGLPNLSSILEVKSAYRKLALKFHPDRGGDQEKMKEINEAYEYIVKNKEMYDNTLRLRPVRGFTIIVGGWERSWEFDNSGTVATTSSGGY